MLLYKSSIWPFLHFFDYENWLMMEELLPFHCSFLIDSIIFYISPKKDCLGFSFCFFPPQKILFTFCDDLKWLHQAYAANAEMRWKQTRPTTLYTPSRCYLGSVHVLNAPGQPLHLQRQKSCTAGIMQGYNQV